MSGTAGAPEPEDEAPAPTAPASPRRPAHESKIFQPSTFATRKAEREAAGPAPGQRLVSLGVSEQPFMGRNSDELEMVTLELLYDLDDPARAYYRTPGGTLQPLYDDQRREQVTPLGTIRRSPRGLSPRTFPEAAPTPPPRPVD